MPACRVHHIIPTPYSSPKPLCREEIGCQGIVKNLFPGGFRGREGGKEKKKTKFDKDDVGKI